MAKQERKGKESARGREAQVPGDIPRPGWRDILLRVKEEQTRDNLSIVAAGVAFYSLLSIFPAIAALVSIYGLIADPADVQQLLDTASGLLPLEARELLNQQLQAVVTGSGEALGIGAVGGLLLALWSAAKGMKALITALNIAYNEEETRKFFRLNGVALALTFGAIVFGIISLSLVVALPALLGFLPLPQTLQTSISLLRWPLLALFVVVALAIIYRYAPNRHEAKWAWVSRGAIVATLLWLVISLLFSFYVGNFGSYNKTYGSVGAVIILLLWFWLTSYLVLLGAELNSEMERQTRRDTTTGAPKPMGRRGARSADTLGRTP